MAKDPTLFNRFFVDNHNTIRNYFRYTFLASCYTVDDYERYYGIRKSNINTWLIPKLKKTLVQNGEEMDPRKRGGHGKYVWDPNPGWFQDGGTLIWKTFKFHTVTAAQVLIYFQVLSDLQNNKNGLSITGLANSLYNKFKYFDESDSEKNYKVLQPIEAAETSDIRKLLFDLQENGIIGQKDRKKVVPDNPLDHLDEQQQRWLYYLSQFYAKVVPYSAAGYYFMDTLLEYQREA